MSLRFFFLGINIFIETNIKGVLNECDNKIKPGTKDEMVNITLTKAGVTIKLPVGFSADLDIVMKCFILKTKEYAISEAIKIPTLLAEKNSDPSFYIKELSYGTFSHLLNNFFKCSFMQLNFKSVKTAS